MRKGFQPQLLTDPKGRLFAFATGSDATTEHEGGTARLQSALTGSLSSGAKSTADLLRSGRLATMPQLLDCKRVSRDLGHIAYAEREVDGLLEASLVYGADGPLQPYGNRFIDTELAFPSYGDERDLAGAWDERSFGFRVRGEKRVKQFRAFVRSLKSGKCVFAGLFLKGAYGLALPGIVLAVEELMRPEHRQAVQAAQAEFEKATMLHLHARVQELNALPGARRLMSIWPQTLDGTRVLYAINPCNGVDADYGGPYEFETLRQWLAGDARGRLNKASVAA